MVVFGGHNEHFGGCGSRLRLHDPGCARTRVSFEHTAAFTPAPPLSLSALPRPFRGLDTQSGVLQKESVDILRTFYGRRNPRGASPAPSRGSCAAGPHSGYGDRQGGVFRCDGQARASRHRAVRRR